MILDVTLPNRLLITQIAEGKHAGHWRTACEMCQKHQGSGSHAAGQALCKDVGALRGHATSEEHLQCLIRKQGAQAVKQGTRRTVEDALTSFTLATQELLASSDQSQSQLALISRIERYCYQTVDILGSLRTKMSTIFEN